MQIDDVQPDPFPQGGGTMTITGRRFSGMNSVTKVEVFRTDTNTSLGNCSSITIVSGTTITCVMPDITNTCTARDPSTGYCTQMGYTGQAVVLLTNAYGATGLSETYARFTYQ